MTSTTATAGAPLARGASSYSSANMDSVAARADALALSIGSRIGVGSLLLACVLLIVVGAQSLLSSLQDMDRNIKVMNEELATANAGLVILNTTMDALPGTSKGLGDVVVTVKGTGVQVRRSNVALTGLAKTTQGLNGRIGNIATSTTDMRGSLEEVGAGTGQLKSTVADLNLKVAPLVATQHEMYLQTKKMGTGVDGMNASLAYVIRTLNYITAPPGGMPFTIRADLPKETLPPIPGLKAESDPAPVFARGAWPVYTGP